MRGLNESRSILIGLIVLAVGQTMFLTARILGWPAVETIPETRPFVVGDTVPIIHGKVAGETARAVPLVNADHVWTAVIAFNSKCIHCDRAVPLWREWLMRSHVMHVIAITRDSLPAAEAYRSKHHWSVRILGVAGIRPRTIEGQMVSRTPWAFLFDSAGVLRYEGQGSNLTVLDSIVAASEEDAVSSEEDAVSSEEDAVSGNFARRRLTSIAGSGDG